MGCIYIRVAVVPNKRTPSAAVQTEKLRNPAKRPLYSPPLHSARSGMADSDIVLRFVYSADTNADMRTFRVLQVLEDAAEELELYKVFFFNNLSTLGLDIEGPVSVLPPINGSLYGHNDLSPQESRYAGVRDGRTGRMVF